MYRWLSESFLSRIVRLSSLLHHHIHMDIPIGYMKTFQALNSCDRYIKKYIFFQLNFLFNYNFIFRNWH